MVIAIANIPRVSIPMHTISASGNLSILQEPLTTWSPSLVVSVSDYGTRKRGWTSI